MLYIRIEAKEAVGIDEMIYLKPSYFSGTLNLTIFGRQGFSVFLFTKNC